MDGNYDINTIAFPLKTICAVKVVQQVLLASGIRINKKGLEMRAAQLVRGLELPGELREKLECLIYPVTKMMRIWYDAYNQCGYPILTPLGTVDWRRSANAILLNEKMDKSIRFVIACEYCFEDHIYELFKGLTMKELYFLDSEYVDKREHQFINFWKDAFLWCFGGMTPDGHLPQEAYNNGFKLALKENNDTAIRHFIDKASPQVVSGWVKQNHSWRYPDLLSPATFCLLVSKLSKTDQQVHLPKHASRLLGMLLHWPYHSFFMEAVHSLASHLTASLYWELMHTVLHHIKVRDRNFDYRKLFTTFWLAGSCHKHGPIPCGFGSVFRNVVMMRDKSLLQFVLNETCAEWKKELLLAFHEDETYTMLIYVNELQLLEVFVRGCAMQRKDLLIQFKANLVSLHGETDYSDIFNDRRKNFAKIVDEIIAEKQVAEEMEQ